ncbi:MAG: hypothetical protein SNJ74_07095 [Fimbriimonadaceae bacterium]
MTDPDRPQDTPPSAAAGSEETNEPAREPVPDNPETFVDDIERIRLEYEDQLRELERQARTAQRSHTKATQTAGTFGSTSAGDRRQMAYGISIAYTIILLPLAGFAVGWLIDSQVGGTLFQALLTLTMAVVGLTVAVAKLSLLGRDEPKPARKSPEEGATEESSEAPPSP